MRRLLPLLSLSVILAGCGLPFRGHDLRVGSVTKMIFIPAHDEQGMMPVYTTVCTGSGNIVSCTPILAGMIPYTDHHADEYDVTIAACDTHQKCRHTTFQTDAATYGTLKIGTWFDRDNPESPRNI